MILRYTIAIGCLVAASAGSGAFAADADAVRQIVVSGHGSVSVPPDSATLRFELHGEGSTSDTAVKALLAKRAMVEQSLATIGIPATALKTGKLSIDPVRGKECDGDNDNDKPRLSEGPCAVRGYIASLSFTAVVAPKDAGTAAGLVGRANAESVSLEDFDIQDDAALRRKAIAAALADARSQAETIAAASGETLGPLLTVKDQRTEATGGEDIIVTARRNAPPAVMAVPILVTLAPNSVERTADLTVTYAIGR